jgi:UDP-glucose 4-epimerase
MSNQTPTIIVTGGAGYIGSHTIIELLQQTDYTIVSIDNFSTDGHYPKLLTDNG